MTGDEVTLKNIDTLDFMTVHSWAWGLCNGHVDYMSMDRDKFTFMLGYYPSIYATISELFTFMINKKRIYMELADKPRLDRARDKCDLLEQVLKTVKLHYESLSRKITLLDERA